MMARFKIELREFLDILLDSLQQCIQITRGLFEISHYLMTLLLQLVQVSAWLDRLILVETSSTNTTYQLLEL